MSNLIQKLKSRYSLSDTFFGLLVCVMLFVSFNPKAKSAFLQLLLKTGIYNAKISTAENRAITENSLFTNEKGEVVSLQSLKGKTVFINFWATWCPPCRAEMPSLKILYDKVKNDPDIVFLTVDVDGTMKNSLAFMKANGYNLPLVVPQTQLPQTLFGGTLPTTVVIGPDGALRFRHEGMADYSSESFYKKLKNL